MDIELGAERGADPNLQPILWLFSAVLLTFLITRFVTRRIRSKKADGTHGEGVLQDISIGGIHLHHQVLGILLMSASGILTFANAPTGMGLNVAAAVFGVGLSLAFDEFALWLHLDDVYWSPEGRQSIDAIFVVLCIIGALVGGTEFLPGATGTPQWWLSVVGLLIGLVISVICLLKGKIMLGVIGVVVAPAAIIGAIRTAKPASWWARRYYVGKPHKEEKAFRRFGPDYDARWNRVRDFFGGTPTLADPGMAPAATDEGVDHSRS